MISINHILQLVDQHEHITGETMTELSRRATGKKDTIRNWRRRLEAGEEAPSASFQNVQAILSAMGIEMALGDTPTPIRSHEEIIGVLSRIEGLDKRGVEVAFSVISSHLLATTGQLPKPSRSDADGQSASASSRREASSSR
jgi:Asp-tRNA(Asn)/Glu-tRNA(Gln) amidotransferase C subunit